MKKRLWKQVIGITLASTMLWTTPVAYAIEDITEVPKNEAQQEVLLPDNVLDENKTQSEVVLPENRIPQNAEGEKTATTETVEQNQPAEKPEAPKTEVAKPIKSDNYFVIDDMATEQNQENYFTYHGAIDPDPNSNGGKGWVTNRKDGDWSSHEVATQHWIWDNDTAKAAEYTYDFTFTGTGVELIGIKSDSYMTFQLDEGEKQLFEIAGAARKEALLYSVDGLDYAKHTVKVSMPENRGGHGLQVSCAKVYGSKLPELETTTIPYTKQDGEVNRFKFSEQGWSQTGDEVHCWSDSPVDLPKGTIWYEVDFIGSQIDIWAGKNRPHGDVSYTIYEKGTDNIVKDSVTVSHYAGKNVLSAKVYSFSGLDEKKVHTLRAVALGTGQGDRKIIDCGQVVVHHQPYHVDDFMPAQDQYALGEGQKEQIRYTVTPSHAVVPDMKFVSENPEIADVDEKTGLITAKKAGNTTITLSSETYPEVREKTIAVEVAVAVPNIDGSVVDVDTQYTEDRYQEIRDMDKVKTGTLTAWKNDKATSSLALISKDSTLKNVTVMTSDLISKDGGKSIPAKNVIPTFIKSTKAYAGPFLGYGSNRPNEPIPEDDGKNRAESADILYQTTPIDMGWNEVQAVWLEFKIPVNADAGAYTTTITVSADGIKTPLTFEYTINVQNAVLPDATSFQDRFSIEFWHHPYASAEYYDVEPFSPEHFRILESMQQIYKEVGGNTIYTSVVEEPWMGQTWSSHNTNERPTYPSMIRWTKNSKGEFSFDYEHFDKWVQFNIDRGLGDKIVMFSIAPWHNSFKYYDEAGKLHTESFDHVGGIGSQKYNEIWTIFLKDLIAHLEQKGWFDRAYIGIDERGFTTGAFDVVESVQNSEGKHLKIMGYMDNVGDQNKYNLALRCTDYSIGDNAAQTGHPEEYKRLLAERDKRGLKTTFYSCTEHRPGNFSLSQPVESYYSVVNTRKEGATGFARWAYDAWVPEPLEDATHNSFEPGDCFVIYPDLKENKEHAVAKYSVRLARMAEGVRDNNKIMLMVEEYPELQPKVDKLYETIKTKAFTANNRYLNENEINTLRNEMDAFKTGLVALTEEYIRLGGKGDINAQGMAL